MQMPSGLQLQQPTRDHFEDRCNPACAAPVSPPEEPQVPGGTVNENFLKRTGSPGLHELEMKPIDINNNTKNDAITFDKDKNEYFYNSYMN